MKVADRIERNAQGELPAQNIVLFDGACGFCTWSLGRIAAHVPPNDVSYVPYQWVTASTLAEFATSPEQCASALQLWNVRERRLYRGADAFNRLVSQTPLGRRAVLIVHKIKPLLLLERAVYAVIARNRLPISAVLGTRRYALIKDPDSNGAQPQAHRRESSDPKESRPADPYRCDACAAGSQIEESCHSK